MTGGARVGADRRRRRATAGCRARVPRRRRPGRSRAAGRRRGGAGRRDRPDLELSEHGRPRRPGEVEGVERVDAPKRDHVPDVAREADGVDPLALPEAAHTGESDERAVLLPERRDEALALLLRARVPPRRLLGARNAQDTVVLGERPLVHQVAGDGAASPIDRRRRAGYVELVDRRRDLRWVGRVGVDGLCKPALRRDVERSSARRTPFARRRRPRPSRRSRGPCRGRSSAPSAGRDPSERSGVARHGTGRASAARASHPVGPSPRSRAASCRSAMCERPPGSWRWPLSRPSATHRRESRTATPAACSRP